jgi:hypothetical protein
MDIRIGRIGVDENTRDPDGSIRIPVEILDTAGGRISITGYNGVAKVTDAATRKEEIITCIDSDEDLSDLLQRGSPGVPTIQVILPPEKVREMERMRGGRCLQITILCTFRVYDEKDRILYHRLVHTKRTLTDPDWSTLTGSLRTET